MDRAGREPRALARRRALPASDAGRAGRGRGRARAVRLAVTTAVALLVIPAGCASTPTAGSGVRTAAVGSEADCLAPDVLAELGVRLDPSLAARASHAPAPSAGRVPEGFQATGVLVCQVGGHVRDSAGTWTAVTATSRDGSPADVASLVATLDRQIAATAGAGVPSPDPSTCAGQAKPVVLWLLDAIDRAVRPSVPVDSCGSPARELLTALDRLTVTGVVDQPVQLVTPSP